MLQCHCKKKKKLGGVLFAVFLLFFLRPCVSANARSQRVTLDSEDPRYRYAFVSSPYSFSTMYKYQGICCIYAVSDLLSYVAVLLYFPLWDTLMVHYGCGTRYACMDLLPTSSYYWFASVFLLCS